MIRQPTEQELRRQIVETCRRLYERRYVVSTDGNVSVRLPGGRLLTTPTGARKGFLREDDLVVTDQRGRPQGRGKPSSEFKMHLAVYRERPDVQAIIHAHPATAVSCSIAGVELAQCILPEVVVTLGKIPIATYATPGTDEVPESIRDLVRCHDAIILERHGSLTVGTDLDIAFDRLETVEHAARVTMLTRLLGGPRPLADHEVDKLIDIGRSLGIARAHESCQRCGNCQGRQGSNPGSLTAEILKLVE